MMHVGDRLRIRVVRPIGEVGTVEHAVLIADQEVADFFGVTGGLVFQVHEPRCDIDMHERKIVEELRDLIYVPFEAGGQMHGVEAQARMRAQHAIARGEDPSRSWEGISGRRCM